MSERTDDSEQAPTARVEPSLVVEARREDDPSPTPVDRRMSASSAKNVPWGWVALVLCCVSLCVTALLIVRTLRGAVPASSAARTVLRSSPDVLVAVRSLARLETVTFHMERVIELTDEQTHLFGLVGANDRILLVAAADVSAGVDLARVRPQDVEADWERRALRITLPPVELFHATLDNQRTRTYRRDTDTFAMRAEDLETRARREAERALRDAALQAGLLTRGRDNADRALRATLASLGFERIELRFREPEIADSPRLRAP